MAMTNENPTTPNKILLQYLKNIAVTGIGSTTAPITANSNAFTYWIGNPGLYFVKGLMNNPLNS